MARLVKDFDEQVRKEHYKVKTSVDDRLPAITVYDNQTGTDSEYYRIYTKAIKSIRKNKDCYVLYV